MELVGARKNVSASERHARGVFLSRARSFLRLLRNLHVYVRLWSAEEVEVSFGVEV